MDSTKEPSDCQTKSSRHINDLPDLCLRVIFSLLPLVDLLRIGQVCVYWKCLQDAVCATKRDVVIFIGRDASNFVQNSKFKIPFIDKVITDDNELLNSLTKKARLSDGSFEMNRIDFAFPNFIRAKQITALLSNITLLTVSLDYYALFWDDIEIDNKNCQLRGINQMIYLIKFWSPDLKTLKMHVYLTDVHDKNYETLYEETNALKCSLIRLINLINTCQVLDHLTVKIDATIFNENETIDWPIISRLNEFYFSFDGVPIENALNIDSFMQKAGQNSKLHKIEFTCFNVESVKKMLLKNADQNLYKKFYFLPYVTLSECEPNFPLNDFCARFINLQSVSISLGSNVAKFYKIVYSLKVLKNLVHLSIDVDMNSTENNESEQLNSDNLQYSTIPQLALIKILEISLKSHEDLNAIKWHEMFPNLQILHSDEDICSDICYQQFLRQDIYVRNDDREKAHARLTSYFTRQKVAKCVRHYTQPFKLCSKLHSIFNRGFNGEIEKWSLDELFRN